MGLRRRRVLHALLDRARLRRGAVACRSGTGGVDATTGHGVLLRLWRLILLLLLLLHGCNLRHENLLLRGLLRDHGPQLRHLLRLRLR